MIKSLLGFALLVTLATMGATAPTGKTCCGAQCKPACCNMVKGQNKCCKAMTGKTACCKDKACAKQCADCAKNHKACCSMPACKGCGK